MYAARLEDACLWHPDEPVGAATSFRKNDYPNAIRKGFAGALTGSNPVLPSESIPVLSTLCDASFASAHRCSFRDTIVLHASRAACGGACAKPHRSRHTKMGV